MAVTLFCLIHMNSAIVLPEEVISVSSLVKIEDGYVFLDGRSQRLWRVSLDGNARSFYDRKGPGPGEFSRLFGIRYLDGRLFLIDLSGQKFIVLSKVFVFCEVASCQMRPRSGWVK